MDEIEIGFTKIFEKIEMMKREEKALSDEIRKKDSQLLSRMAHSAIPVIKESGMNLLRMGKEDTRGEMYDPLYYPSKMIVLGKADPVGQRQDNPLRVVTDQYCVISEEGEFFELMYSFDGFLTDSYLQPLDPRDALNTYGYQLLFILYKLLSDHLISQEIPLSALKTAISYISLPSE